MKKLTLLVTGLLSCSIVFSQKTPQGDKIVAQEIQVTFTGVTGNLLDYVEPKGTVNEVVKTMKPGYHPKDDWILNEHNNPNALPNGEDPVLQKSFAEPAYNKSLDYNWDAISNFNVSPADPSVDVGPNHVVHMTNGPSGAYIQIYDKTGTPIGSQVYFDNTMGMAGGLGDPIVLYDERADRWMLSEFSASGNNMHIAMSQTPDPGGAYYTFVVNAPSFPDYPKFSIWEDAYIITTNESGNSPIYALNRADLLSGTPTTAQRFTIPSYSTIGFQAGTPVSLNGTTLPPAGSKPMVMRMEDDGWTGITQDALEIWEIDIDWANSANSSVTQTENISVSNFDTELCGYTSFSCIDQPGGGSQDLDPLRELLMNRIHYRNFGTHESIVCCHVTDMTGNDEAGVRWYELRRTSIAGGWSVYQEGTYGTLDGVNRWMPSIGISATGNIGLAYNVSDANSIYPSLRYTGRQECHLPLGEMNEPETEIATGTVANGSNRYGDYNALGCDPSDGQTFYFTGVYNPTSGGRTRVAAFNIDPCATDPAVQFNITSATVNESDADVANGCLDYYVLDVPMSIGLAPSQDADVTVTITGGTATEGVDFDLVNASFTLNGANLTGSAQIHVYNDDYVEGSETIDLAYTMNANGGDAYNGAVNQTVTVTIDDDDEDISTMTSVVTVFTQDFEGGLAPFTTVNAAGGPQNDPFQVDNAAGAASGAFPIPDHTDFAYVNDDACDCDQDDVDLTTQSFDLSGYSAATLSFESYYLNNEYLGNQEVATILVSTNGGAFNTVLPVPGNGSWGTVNVDLTPYVGNADVQVAFNYSDGTGWLYGWAIDDVIVTGENPIGVQTALNTGASMESNLGPNETVNFIDPNSGKVIMTLDNTSSFDYGCVTVEVDRDGTGASQFNSASAGDFLHDKTYTVTPTNSNPTGTYDVTVYYEETEVAGWEAATGNNRNAAEVIKVAGNNAINDVTPGNFGSFNIENIAATVGDFNGNVTFTASFGTGFSGFGVGIYNPGNVAPTANFSASATTACIDVDINFNDLSTGGADGWAWNFGDGLGTSTAQNPTYAYPNAGTYTVTLTASNINGSDIATQASYITIVAGESYTQDLEICDGESVTVGSSTYTTDGSYTDLIVVANACDTTITTNLTVLSNSTFDQTLDICEGSSVTVGTSTYNADGVYTDVLTNAVGCDSTITTTLVVNALPTVDITPTTIDTVCYENAIPVTLVGSPNGGTFSGNGVSGTTFDPSVAGIGTHTITYDYTDGNGCSNSTTVEAVINDCSGVEEALLDGVILTPNPNDGNFEIIGLDNDSKYEIYDSRGRLVLGGTSENTNTPVHINNIDGGTYYLHGTANGKEGILKFIVVK